MLGAAGAVGTPSRVHSRRISAGSASTADPTASSTGHDIVDALVVNALATVVA